MSSEETVLKIENLSIAFGEDTRRVEAVKNLNIQLNEGETLGIVGESGSGKSISSLAIIGLLPPSAKMLSGKIAFNSKGKMRQLLEEPEAEMRKIRGKDIAMIFQEPMTSLNPVHTCGAQVAESIRLHRRKSKKAVRELVITLFEQVELPRPQELYDSYPHQISGGQKQRVMIAMALSCNPKLIIADEPTTALDVTVQKKILNILRDLCKKQNTALIFITHDLGVVAEIADRVCVMYRGEVLEEGRTAQVFNDPKSAYTKALLACRPRLDAHPYRLPVVSDFMTPEAKNGENEIPKSESTPGADSTILSVKNLKVWFPIRKDWKGRTTAFLHAVNDVSFDVRRGETLGLVGESGCGKTTLGRALLKLIPTQGGEVFFNETEILQLSQKAFKPLRKKVQIIFQDPYASLNPRFTIGAALLEPMKVHKIGHSNRERTILLRRIIDRVGMQESALQKYPHEFSGGQRQRICIARALVIEPEFIVCDESVSALDVSVQAQVLNLLNDLKRDFGLTYIFISHDLSVVKYMSDRLVVMRRGKIEEMGDAKAVYADPKSEYTRELIDAIPVV